MSKFKSAENLKKLFGKKDKEPQTLMAYVSTAKTASEGEDRKNHQAFFDKWQECLRDNIKKRADEKLSEPPDFNSRDPHAEYIRRVSALDKLGGEMSPEDVLLAVQAYHTLKTHGLRENRLKNSKV